MSKYYAVRAGRQVGIFSSWKECEAQVKGFANAQFKSFKTMDDAQDYINEKATQATRKRPRETSANDDNVDEPASKKSKVEVKYTTIYTDGSCLGNGKARAIAGIGVYFGDNDTRNVSEPFTIGIRTNQRAEIYAVTRALQSVNANEHVKIVTDSRYVIDSMTKWIHGWKKKNFKNVKNTDLLIELDKLIATRSGKTSFEHVYGHMGIHGNEMADKLAVAGSKKYKY